ncbi:MAG TPA: type VI secretion system baseplate subunit TssK [Myxococcota bacterium]|nr:type VI secretion system baseplate subunit TssK [Myxococcota bacterium]
MTTRPLNPVAWSEGMFLRPQHLQQSELYGDARLHYHLRALNPFHWGVAKLEVDEEALSDHRVSLLALDAVLPGGTIVRYPGNALVETREFNPTAERLSLYLGLRHLSPSEPNAAPVGNGARDVRWRVQPEELPDLQRGGYMTPVDLVYPNLRLFFDGQEHELEVHESMKIAEIRATGELKTPFALSATYCPPLLAMQAFAPLFDEVSRCVSQIAARVRVVAGRTATIAIADLPRMWMRYTLARMTPVLRHLLSTGDTRPFHLYTALVETAGSLAAFHSMEAAELPLYHHEDLYGCFHALIEFIDAQLAEAVPTNFFELPMPFDPAKKYYVTSDLNVERVDPRNAFFLAIKAPMDSKQLAQHVAEYGKASSCRGVPPLVMLNTKGLRLEPMPAAPTEIAARTGFEYFKVDPHGPAWSKVKDEFCFALSLGKLENADVRLYVVIPKG